MNNYGIREGYTARENPAYFVDDQPDFKTWQPDVLPIAAHIARKTGAKLLIDIGCGRGEKLIPYAGEFDIIGVDYGENIEYCRTHHAFGQWIERDLETGLPQLAVNELVKSVLVCSDVIEHLKNPAWLMHDLSLFAKLYAKASVLSTPDRLRTYGFDQNGPPGNLHHVREWTLPEMVKWITEEQHCSLSWAGWTMSNNVERQKNTMLLIFQSHSQPGEIGAIEEVFEVERA